MAASWHSIRAGVVKSSMWCTVRNSRNPEPRSRTLAAALAEMQSWVCTMSNRSPRRVSPDVRASMCENTLSVRVAARGGAWMIIAGTLVGRKKPSAGFPSAIRVTSAPSAARASANSTLWTAPPRGLTE